MLNRLKPFAAAVLSFSLVGGVALAEDKETDLTTVLATVNGQAITLGHVILAKRTLPQQYQSMPASVLFPGIIDQLIQQTALWQSFEGDMPKRVLLSLDNETRSLMAGEVVERILQTAVTPERVQEVYDTDFAGKDQEQEYNAAHILVETEEQALAIKGEIDAGANFAQMARERSTGPSGPRGGDLGWFGPGVMVPAFETVVLQLAPGEVSAPVETQFGWHVIMLKETRVPNAPDLEEVRQEIEQKIRTDAVEGRIAELVEAAQIDRDGADAMDPEVLNKYDAIDLQ